MHLSWRSKPEQEERPIDAKLVKLDGKLLARCIAAGAIAGEASTGRLLVALGDDTAAQMIENARSAVRALPEARQLAERKTTRQEIVLNVPDAEAQNAALAALTGTEPQSRTWADDDAEARLAQQFAALTGARL